MRFIKLLTILFFTWQGCSTQEKGKLSDESVASEWEVLTDTDDLTGWDIINGTADFEIEAGVITGTTRMGSPNTFLATKKSYRDFILEAEILADPTINSGIQFRSNSFPDYRNGVVHGYQCEIDPSPRAWSGGIYDEQRRGWLYDLEQNPDGKKAFKNGQWNHYRIEAIGPAIRTWVNGVSTANLIDSLTQAGFIALQVHSIADSTQAGKTIRWRNVRILTENLDAYRWEHRLTAPLVMPIDPSND